MEETYFMSSKTLLEWDELGSKIWETGLRKGVLYPQSNNSYPKGVAWNGLTSVEETPDGAEANDFYADDIKYASVRSTENYKGTINAYTYPDEFMACNGEIAVVKGVSIGQQTRQTFGLCYRTIIGNDTDGEEYGYKLHLVYGATISPSQKTHSTVNDSPELEELSWEFDTVPVSVSGYKNTATLEIDSTQVEASKLAELEAILYGTPADGGTAEVPARLPFPDEVISIMGVAG